MIQGDFSLPRLFVQLGRNTAGEKVLPKQFDGYAVVGGEEVNGVFSFGRYSRDDAYSGPLEAKPPQLFAAFPAGGAAAFGAAGKAAHVVAASGARLTAIIEFGSATSPKANGQQSRERGESQQVEDVAKQ